VVVEGFGGGLVGRVGLGLGLGLGCLGCGLRVGGGVGVAVGEDGGHFFGCFFFFLVWGVGEPEVELSCVVLVLCGWNGGGVLGVWRSVVVRW
jgi:hypothetical protein